MPLPNPLATAILSALTYGADAKALASSTFVPSALLQARADTAAKQSQDPTKTQSPSQAPNPKQAQDPKKPSSDPIRVVVEAEQPAETPHGRTTTTGGKVPVEFLENPRHVDQIGQETIRAQGAYEATELWRYSPNTIAGERGTVRIRGFDIGQSAASGGQLFDGVRTSVYNLNPTNLYNIERVEILKGPAGVMYGQGQPGGLVNYVLKKPQAEQRNNLQINWDHWGERRIAVDSTGPVTEAGDWLYRINISAEETETFRRNESISNIYAAPSVTWQPSDTLRITLLAEAFNDRRTGGRGYGTPVVQGNAFALPRDYSISDPDDYREVDGIDAQLQIEANLGRGWTWTSTLFGGRSYYENMYHEGMRSAAEDAAADPTYRRQFRNQKSDTRQWGYDIHAVFETQSGGVSHRLLVGADYTGIKDPQFPAIDAYITNPTSASNPDGANSINLNQPYAATASRAGYGIDSNSKTTGERRNIGGYADYRVGLESTWFASVGARYDLFDEQTTTINRVTSAVTNTDDDHSRVSWTASLLWKFDSNAATYYAYNEGFRAQGWTTVNNANGPFDPLTWNQHEVGLSYENDQRTFGANLAVFQLTRDHELVPDTSPGAASGAQIDIGQTRSEGVEVTLAGRISDAATVRAVYGYNHAYVYKTSRNNMDDTASLQGAELAGVPMHTASLTWNHQVRQDLNLWASWRFVGSQPARLDDTDPLQFDLRQYHALDIGATLARDDWSVRLGIDNVFDEDYVTVYRSPGHAVNRGEPRTLSLMFSTQF